MNTFTVDKLTVKTYPCRKCMGEGAAADIAAAIAAQLREKAEINMIFAAAPSQNDVLASLVADKSIEWGRINAYHMDEYIGLRADAPQGFGNFLRARLFSRVPFKSVSCIDSTASDAQKEADRYAALLRAHPADVVVMGIGENGHIAFNDPGVADFNDPATVKIVALDEVCRRQQVHDGCFASLDEVPKTALTLTVPTLIAAPDLFCIVPAATKAEAVRRTLKEEVSETCPASVLRTREGAVLYLDPDSAALL